MAIMESAGLGRRYRDAWALRDCSIAIPAGRVVALVGPNGAGKSTLLHLVAGLISPSEGRVAVMGGLTPGSAAALDAIAFVGQNAPLYRSLPVSDMVRMADAMNRDFDRPYALSRLADLGIPPRRKVGRLSGGQQAQVALTLALAKRPHLLILDEPLASLDPLARHDFMAAVMAAVREAGLTVVFSSHMVAELERVADHLVLLTAGRVRIAGDVADLRAGHRLLSVPAAESAGLAGRLRAVHALRDAELTHLLIRTGGRDPAGAASWSSREPGLEELVLGYMRASAATGEVPEPAAWAGRHG